MATVEPEDVAKPSGVVGSYPGLPPDVMDLLRRLQPPSEVDAAMRAFLEAESKRQAEHAQLVERLAADQDAYEHVGVSPEARLRWLYEFAHETPPAKSRRNVAREVEAFCQFYGYSGDELRTKAYRSAKPGSLPFYSLAGDRPASEMRADEGLVEELKQEVRVLWERLRKTGVGFEFGPTPVLKGLFSQEADGLVRVFFYGGPTLKEVFLANVVKLLFDVGPFRFCERADCGRAFVPSRPRKRFCRELCAGRDRIARFRANRRETADERHERYRRDVRKKLPNAKPARRPRGRNKERTK